MFRIERKTAPLAFACSLMVLAGCQAPLAPSVARQEPARMNCLFVSADSEPCVYLDLGVPDCPEPADEEIVASVQKDPECATVQLGDTFLHLLRTFTGR